MRVFKLIVPCLAVATVASSTLAQPGGDQPPRPPRDASGQPAGDRPMRGGQRNALSPEKAKAAWEVQATGVATRLGLSADQAKAVVKAYTEARESHNKALQKLMEERRERRDEDSDRREAINASMKAMEELNTAERTKLQTALASATSADHASKAITSLGTFNRQWDTMADAIAGFNLEPAKRQTALDAVETFVVNQSKAPRPSPDADMEAIREAMREAREKLADDLKKVLSEDQMKAFDEATRPGRGGRGPGGGGRGEGGGRGGEGGRGG